MYAPTKTAYLWTVGANLRVRPGFTKVALRGMLGFKNQLPTLQN
jgi:hypothetical protein